MAHLPILDKHIASLDQKFPEDDTFPLIAPQSNLQPPHDTLNGHRPEPHRQSQSSPPPPLVDSVALITPKQSKDSKKWSVGVNYASTAIVFEYLESARLAIQNDGRLFIAGAKKTLSATHSASASSASSACSPPLPRISHVSVPRQIYFSNNAVVRVSREWHIGELLPMIYTANMRPPTVSSAAKTEYNDAVSDLQFVFVYISSSSHSL